MKKLLSILLINCIVSNSLFATDCTKPVQYITEGTVASCSGFLFSPKKESELRLINEEYKTLKLEIEILTHKNDLYSKQLELSDQISQKEAQKAELWRDRAEVITVKYTTLEDSRTTRDWVFLVSGIALTVLAGWSLGQAAK